MCEPCTPTQEPDNDQLERERDEARKNEQAAMAALERERDELREDNERLARLLGDTDPNAPALPNNAVIYGSRGLTIREHFASLAMQGLLGSEYVDEDADTIARIAIKRADDLITELNRPGE